MSSKLTQLLGVLGIASAFTSLVDAEAGPHRSVTRFGEGWTVRTATGQSTVVHSVEALLDAVALPALPFRARETAAAQSACDRLELLCAGPLAEPAATLTAAELLLALRSSRLTARV